MTDQEPERTDVVAALREQTNELVQQIPGPLRKVSVSAGDSAVTVEWAEPDGDPASPNGSNGSGPTPATAESAGLATAGSAGATATGTTEASEDDGNVPVTAPLVGTFYRAPEPGAEPFVEVGSTVEADQTIGIVEAMKLMNPVKAPQPGTVAAIRVDDGEMVEFGQPLLELAPA